MSKSTVQTFFDHWEELRGRIVKVVILFGLASFVFYGVVPMVLEWLIKPMKQVVFTAPAEAFLAHVYVALVGGIIISLPYTLYHIWSFLAAGLKSSERKFVYVFGPLSLLFFLAGIGFAYFIILPISIQFLMGFSTASLVPMVTIGRYIGFVSMLVLGFGIVFELPLMLAFLTKIGLVTPTFLIARRRIAILVIVIVSALLTPPDVVTQVLMAVPLALLYELGIIFSKIVYHKS